MLAVNRVLKDFLDKGDSQVTETNLLQLNRYTKPSNKENSILLIYVPMLFLYCDSRSPSGWLSVLWIGKDQNARKFIGLKWLMTGAAG
jgi:hypothetical protein